MRRKLVLKDLSSTDIDISDWQPAKDDVFVCLDITVGYSDENNGENLFYVTLATPEALLKHREGPILIENRTLVVTGFNYDTIRDGVQGILEKCSRDTWQDSCAALQRYFQWEYEDYAGDN